MRRREIIAGLVGVLGLRGFPEGASALAQEPGRVFRLGVLVTAASSLAQVRATLLPALQRSGFSVGRNLAVDERGGELAHLPALARELVALGPDAILAFSTPAVAAARAASERVPIISFGPDLLALGYAASTSRPAGNVTGIFILATEIEPKRLLILQEAVPNLRRVGVMFHESMTRKDIVLPALADTARERGLWLVPVEIGAVPDFKSAFESLRAERAEALLVTAHSVLWGNIDLIGAEAEAARLPTMCEWSDIQDRPCVLGYGPSRRALFERVAEIVAQVFRGVPPSQIPIESPSQIGLAVNLKAARSLGLTIPASVLARADEVIE